MLLTLSLLFTLYTLLRIYISIMQIGYISDAKKKTPVLLAAADFIKAGNYSISKERVSIIAAFVEYVLFIFWIGFGISWVATATAGFEPVWQAITAVWIFLAVGYIVTAPIDWYTTFVVDKKFGFTKSTKALYLRDQVITAIITLVVSALIVAVIHVIVVSSTLWWLYTFLFLMVVVIALNIFFPIVRALFFDKLSPLPEGDLKQRLEKLFSENGFATSGLFVSDASKRDARLNAYFAGLGGKKRVVLYDTLVEKLSPCELEAVLGHELGHYNHKDIIKNIAMTGLMLFVTLAIFGNLPIKLFVEMQVVPSSGVLMILFLLLSPMLFFILMPLMGKVSRYNEFRADQMGSELGGREHLVTALVKLVTENKSFPKSHPIYLFFYATHPPVLERFEAMGVDTDKLAMMDSECPKA